MSELTAHEVLVKARNRIGHPNRWCRGNLRTTNGRVCAIGAVEAVSPGTIRETEVAYELVCGTPGEAAALALIDAAGVYGDDGQLGDFNDEHHHAEVLAAFDRAIAATAPEPDVSFVTEPVAVA